MFQNSPGLAAAVSGCSGSVTENGTVCEQENRRENGWAGNSAVQDETNTGPCMWRREEPDSRPTHL